MVDNKNLTGAVKQCPPAEPAKTSVSTIIQWAFVVIAPVLVFYFTTNAGFTLPQASFYSITSVALILWALGLLSDTIVAVSLPVAYVVLKVAPAPAVFSSWNTDTGWIVYGGIIFAAIMTQTGLAKRLALWAMHITGGSFNRLLFGIVLAGFLIAPAIPSVMGKAALLSSICIAICEALNFEKKSKEASAVMLAGFISVAAAKMGFLTGGADVTMYVQMLSTTSNQVITWGDYFLHNFPLAVIYAPLSLLVLIFVLRPKTKSDSGAFVARARKEQGPICKDEMKAAILIFILIVLLITDRWHGIKTGWVLILLSLVAFLPPVGLMNDKKLSKLPFGPVFFVVGCMSIGSAAKATGVDLVLANGIAPLLEGTSEVGTIFMSYFAGTALNFLLTPLAAFSAMTVPLTTLSMELGINPIPVMYAFSYGLEQYIFPYEYAVLLFFYATGWIELKHIILVFSVRFIVALIMLFALAVPYWKALGLFTPVGM